MTPGDQPDSPRVALARVTLAEQTAELLKNRVVWGELPPGARLVETEIAAELGISRTPVRQALQRLESDGLAVRDGWRLIVAPFDITVAVETMIIRELLEPFAASESATRLGEPELARLRSILTEMEAQLHVDAPNPKYGAELNMEFHQILNSRCPYRRVVEVIQVARDAHSALRLYSSYTNEDLHRVHEEHIAILDAATAASTTAGGGERLGELVREHMREARAALLRNIGSDVPASHDRGAAEHRRQSAEAQ